jgi:hypothetical protein
MSPLQRALQLLLRFIDNSQWQLHQCQTKLQGQSLRCAVHALPPGMASTGRQLKQQQQ